MKKEDDGKQVQGKFLMSCLLEAFMGNYPLEGDRL